MSLTAPPCSRWKSEGTPSDVIDSNKDELARPKDNGGFHEALPRTRDGLCVAAGVSAMRRLATDVRKSEFESPSLDIKRPYFLLRAADGATYRTAERLVPLQGGSNFRDVGGYPGAGGKHLRWGLLFRSAAMPKLTDADYQLLSSLKIRTVVDLRSQDERQLSPVDWRTKPRPQMIAVNYPGAVLFRRLQGYNGPAREFVTERLYWDIPL